MFDLNYEGLVMIGLTTYENFLTTRN